MYFIAVKAGCEIFIQAVHNAELQNELIKYHKELLVHRITVIL